MWQRTLTGVEPVQGDRLNLGVPLQVRPVLVSAHDTHLMDVVAVFKHQTDPVVPHVVEVQVHYLKRHTGIVEHFGNLLAANGENQ